MRVLRERGHEVVGLDALRSDYTEAVGSITDRAFLREHLSGVEAVMHAATLHKPHLVTHPREAFVDINVRGTLLLLEEAIEAGVRAFVYTSTTSAFGSALTPAPGAPAVWVTEEIASVARNIYGVTKLAAESLCELFHRSAGLPCVVLRTSRFFPEEDDRAETRRAYADANVKANELLYRRVDLADVVEAHLLALARAPSLGCARYVISATTPFTREDLSELRTDAPAVLRRRVPDYADEYARRGWSMFPSIDRVYANDRARRELGWQPRYDFVSLLDRLRADQDPRSPLARAVGAKGYHAERFTEGPYPVA